MLMSRLSLVFGMILLLAEVQAAPIPWTTSRIQGSPEPPYLTVAERVFPQATFKEPVEIGSQISMPWVFVLESNGRLHALDSKHPDAPARLVADFRQKYPSMGPAYSFTFHPGFTTNHFMFVCLITADGSTNGSRISRFTLTPDPNPTLDLSSEQIIITWLGGGHNGGSIHFGADGMLYISTGDGSGPSPPDPRNTGQDLSDLLSSILRIDVDHPAPNAAYSIPKDNPFIQRPNTRPENWAYGLRNPWKISIEPGTSTVWVGDVGWELWEMIFRIDEPGFNGGWSIIESRQPVKPNNPRGPTPIRKPIADHSHDEAASITGGIFYRDSLIPRLQGTYIYGDWETGKMWALRTTNGVLSEKLEIADTPLRIVGFGEGPNREFYFLDHGGGGVYRLAPNPAAASPAPFPRKLSETGLFTSIQNQTPQPGVHAFDVTAPLWTDGAQAQRWIAIPGSQPMRFIQDYWLAPKNLTPTNTVLARTVRIPDPTRHSASSPGIPIETQLLHYNGDGWNAYSYRWLKDQSDAELVPIEGMTETIRVPNPENPDEFREVSWRYHSRAECLRCHNMWNGTTLGFNPAQLSKVSTQNKSTPPATEWDRLLALHVVESPAQSGPQTVDPFDPAQPLESRARSYLHANCGHCHRNAAGGSVLVMLNLQVPLKEAQLIDAKPVQGNLGIEDARLIVPGDPLRSLLLYRFAKSGTSHMPHLGATLTDPRALALLSDWTLSLSTSPNSHSVQQIEQALATIQSPSSLEPGKSQALTHFTQTAAEALALRIATASHPGIWKSPHSQALLAAMPELPDPLIRDLLTPLLPASAQRSVLGPNPDLPSILKRTGNVRRGESLFQGANGSACANCHKFHNNGREIGPDLTQIGQKYPAKELLTHILQPNLSIDPTYTSWMVETVHGENVSGRLLVRDSNRMVIMDALGANHEWKPSDIKELSSSKLSLMPEGLLNAWTADEVADLLAFLRNP